MTRSNTPSIDDLKARAKRLRAGSDLTHSAALERVAKQYGFRDWNTLSAVAQKQTTAQVREQAFDPRVGDRISGRCRGQGFEGTIIRAAAETGGGHTLTIDFDEAIDVVEFDSFSAFRKRVSCKINKDGVTSERLSNGTPILEIEMHDGD
jgi:hypothetical protein